MVAVAEKEPALVPEKAAPVRESAAVPVFLMVSVWVAAVDPTTVDGKVNEVGERVTAADCELILVVGSANSSNSLRHSHRPLTHCHRPTL